MINFNRHYTKKRIIYPLFLILVALLTFGCSNERADFVSTIDLQLEGRLIFQLDSVTSRNSRFIEYCKGEDNIVLYNSAVHSIYFFDVKTKQQKAITPLSKEGPMAIPGVTSFKAISYDSIYIYSDASNSLFRIDTTGRILEKKNILSNTNDDPSISGSQFAYNEKSNSFIFPIRRTVRTSDSKNKALLIYDINNDSKQFLGEFPESYYQGPWGNFSLFTSIAVLTDEEKLLLSYVFDENLYSFDLRNNQVTTISFKLDGVPENFKSENDLSLNYQSYYQIANSWYKKVYYDPYSNLILRDISKGQKIEKNDDINKRYPSLLRDIYSYTLITDKNGKRVAEIPGRRLYDDVFSNEDGLYIRDYGYQRDNEDILVFNHYKIVKK
jgi:hypothetical protein